MSKITDEHLGRAACVYIRQSSPGQLQNNHESRRRQYALADQAKARAFAEVIIIDDDLGRSGDGIARPGFERLLALVCEGRVGAVFAIEASRLARNGRDWHTLIDLCGLVGALLVDEVGEYDPRHPNDRLMLGMKGTFSEMELSLLRQRAIEAIWLKAARGEHFSLIAVGYVRTPSGRLDKDPDLRVREAVALVFRKFDELQSARQVLLWLRQESIELPTMGYAAEGRRITWKRPTYTRVQHVLTNPVYCGAYVFGRTTTEVGVKDGRKSTRKVRRSKQDWRVCIWDHHEGYISRNAFERNQQRLTENTNMWGESVRGAIRRGESLLAGLLRCGHCGRKLNVAYTGTGVTYARYICRGEVDTGETNPCISFGGWRVDQAVATELLKVISPLGVQAALQAIDACNSKGDDKQRHIELALEQARFEAKHARRQYHAVDPDNRLVAAELERRWNECLEAVCRLETDLSNAHLSAPSALSQQERQSLLALGADLSRAWDHPKASAETRKRIVRTVLKEILVRVQDGQIQMVLHWQGGDHTAFALPKNKTGEHRWRTDVDTVKLIAALARQMPDFSIASMLNRLSQRTAKGLAWTEARIRGFRSDHGIAVYRDGERAQRGELNLDEAAKELGVSKMTILRMIDRDILAAQQSCKGTPWVIRKVDLQSPAVARAAAGVPNGAVTPNPNQESLDLQ
jgi:DNA invertase Pin-like site-specific DNA recombinase